MSEPLSTTESPPLLTPTAVPLLPPTPAASAASAIVTLPGDQPAVLETVARRPPTTGLPPRPAGTRYQLLDPLRGAACLMLMLYHAAFYAQYSWVTGSPETWSWGGLGINLVSRLWIGVPLFFVISGYCIAASLDSLRRRPHRLREFYYRRMRRIYPPLWAGLLLGVAVTLLVSCHPPTYERCLQLPRLTALTPTDWLANLTATATWVPKLSGEDSQHLLLNAWTLCYEEQFYVVAGLLLLLSPRRMFLAAYGVAVISLALRHLCRMYDVPIQGFFFDGHWLIFACGMLLYQQLHYLGPAASRAATFALGVGGLYGLSERLWAAEAWDRHVGEYILVACLAAIALRWAKPWDQSQRLHRWLTPLRWVGQISFSLYLTHFPITVLTASLLAAVGVTQDGHVLLITLPICLLLSFPVAWLFYQQVERRFLNTLPRAAAGQT